MTKPKPKEVLIPPMPVVIRGKHYPTVQIAAKALRVKPNTIYVALHKGRIDHVGLGPGKFPRYRKPMIPPKPIRVGGEYFPSMQELSLFLGRSKAYVSNKLKRYANALDQLDQEVLAVRLRQEAKNTNQAFAEHNARMNKGIPNKF